MLPLVEAVRHLCRVDVDAETARGVAHGVVFPATALGPAGADAGPLAVVGPDGSGGGLACEPPPSVVPLDIGLMITTIRCPTATAGDRSGHVL